MSDQAHALAAEIIRIEASYRPVAVDIDRLALANDREVAIREIATKCRPLLASLIKASNAYPDLTRQWADAMIQDAQDKFSAQRTLLISICVIATALAAAAGIVITRGITRALGAEPTDLAGITKRVAGGDLSRVAGAHNAPEGSVPASMGEMQRSLANLIGRVCAAADNIATGSNQIAVGNTDLSSRTEEQAAALQETASSMEELTSTVKQNADNAQQASTLSTAASGVASKGNAVVGRVSPPWAKSARIPQRFPPLSASLKASRFKPIFSPSTPQWKQRAREKKVAASRSWRATCAASRNAHPAPRGKSKT